MNRREKALIVILAAVVILLGGFKLLIEPQIEYIAAAKEERTQAISNRDELEQNKLMETLMKNNNQELEQQILTDSVRFLPEIETDNLHIFFQKMAETVKIRYDSFTMTGKTITQVAKHQVVDFETSYPAKEAANQLREMNQSNKTSGENKPIVNNKTGSPDDLIEMVTVSLQFKGTYNQGLQLIDQINHSGRLIRISSLDMTQHEDKPFVVSITAECYGIAKNVNDIFSADTLPNPSGKPNPFAG